MNDAAPLAVPPTDPGLPPTVTVVVVTFRAREMLAACLNSLAAQTMPHELLVVDNHSTDGSEALLAERLEPRQILRLPENLGFAGGVAAALAQVSTPFVALLNDDAQAAPTWLAELYAVAVTDPTAAAWTSLLLLADQPWLINNAGVTLDNRWYGCDIGLGAAADSIPDGVSEVFGFCGGAALLRTEAIADVGGFPGEFFLYYEDLDTSWRLRLAGWEIRRVPTAVVRHAHSATSDQKSDLFHFYNERNRLLTLIRCAPAGVAASGVLRFVVTTGSLLAKRLLGRQVPAAANFRPALRARVLASVVGRLPGQLRNRRRIGRSRGTSAQGRDVVRNWVGRDHPA